MRPASTRPIESLAIDIVAEAGTAENAKPVAETLQALLTLGKNAIQGFRRDGGRPPGEISEGYEWLLQAVDSVLAQARVETNEGFVRLHSEPPVDIAEGIRLLAPVVSQARAAARRTQSVNNLKQIGLAFHNYALSAQSHFPATLNRDKGKFPYSWRVAILPYLEQNELYNQYNFDEPWDGPNNRKLIDKMPVIYAYPGPAGAVEPEPHVVLRHRRPVGHRRRRGRGEDRADHRRHVEHDPRRRGEARYPVDQARGHPVRPERRPARAGRVHAGRLQCASSPTDRCITSRSPSIRWS